MNYVTTNIRIPEEDYLRLKEEAAKQRKSLAAVIRGKLGSRGEKKPSEAEVKALMEEFTRSAREAGKHAKGPDSVTFLRQMRYEGKW